MSFGAFLAAKYHTEHALFLSCEKKPPAVPSTVTAENAKEVKLLSAANAAWLEADSKLYGLILLAMPAHLKTHLNAHSPYKGTLSMLRLKARFNVSDASDRKGAIANVSKSYIDSRATISTKDITRQYDLMTQAHSDYELAGGTCLITVTPNQAIIGITLDLPTVCRTHISFDGLC